MKNLTLIILLFAMGLGFYAYLQHREVKFQEQVVESKEREAIELREKNAQLAADEAKAVEAARTEQEKLDAIQKQVATQATAHQNAGKQEVDRLKAELEKEKGILKSLNSQRNVMAARSQGAASLLIEKQIRQDGEDIRSYEQRVNAYRASVLMDEGTLKQRLVQLTLNYQAERARIQQFIWDQELAIQQTKDSQTEWKKRRTDYDRPRRLQELNAALNAQNLALRDLRNQIGMLKNSEKLDIASIQNQIRASVEAARAAGKDSPEAAVVKNQISNLKNQKSKVDQAANLASAALQTLNAQIQAQKAKVRAREQELSSRPIHN